MLLPIKTIRPFSQSNSFTVLNPSPIEKENNIFIIKVANLRRCICKILFNDMDKEWICCLESSA